MSLPQTAPSTTTVVPAHRALFVRSAKYPQLVSTVCSCGRSAFGESLPDSAALGHERHAAHPTDGSYREREITVQLFGAEIVSLAAHPSTRPNTTVSRRHP